MCRRWFILLFLLSATFVYAAKPVPKAQEVFAPYWTSEPGWDTEIQLKNNLPSRSLIVTPVLRLASGQEIPLSPVSISPETSVSVWANQGLLEHSANLLNQPGSFGSVVLRFSADSALNLHATTVVTMQGQPITFSIPAYPSYPSPSMQIAVQQIASKPHGDGPGSLEGIWWQPRSELTDMLVISNSSNTKIDGTFSMFDATGKQWSVTLGLAPLQTQRMAISDLLQTAGLSGTYGGFRFEVAAGAHALRGLHFMYNEAAKFAETLEVVNRDPRATLRERAGKDARQWTLWAPMLALRRPDPALGLPARTVLQPTILVRNTTAKNISAGITLNWHGASAAGQAKLPELQLAPYATQQISINSLQSLLRIPENSHWALVSLTTNAAPDDLIAIASSREASGRYGVEARFVGGRGGHFAGGEWRVDANHNAIAAITNVGSKTTDALLTLHYENGQKEYELRQTIAPGGQMWVNLAQLVRNRVADRNGNMLPSDLNSVTYDIRDLTAGNDGLLQNEVALDSAYGFWPARKPPSAAVMKTSLSIPMRSVFPSAATIRPRSWAKMNATARRMTSAPLLQSGAAKIPALPS